MAMFKITADRKYEIWERTRYTVQAESYEKAKAKVTKGLSEKGGVYEDGSRLLESTKEPISRKENFAMAECDMLIPDDNDVDPDNNNPIFEIQEQFSDLLSGECEDWPPEEKEKITEE